MILAIYKLQDLDNEKFWRLLHNKTRGNNKKKEKMSLKIRSNWQIFEQIILKR